MRGGCIGRLYPPFRLLLRVKSKVTSWRWWKSAIFTPTSVETRWLAPNALSRFGDAQTINVCASSIKNLISALLRRGRHAASYPTTRKHRPLSVRVVTFVGIVIPLLVVVAIPFTFGGGAFIGRICGYCMGMVFADGAGDYRWFPPFIRNIDPLPRLHGWQFIWAVLGSMAVQGPLFRWVARHRSHHQHADTKLIRTSPHHSGEGVQGILRVFGMHMLGGCFEPEQVDLIR